MKPVDVLRLQQHVGRRIAELRSVAGMTQEQLAERLEVSTRYMQSMEGGAENLTLETIAKLAAALRARPIEFFEPTVTRRPRPGRPKKSPV